MGALCPNLKNNVENLGEDVCSELEVNAPVIIKTVNKELDLSARCTQCPAADICSNKK